ncbi:hypothetical protein DAETH_47180 (plasmid) [Deinococcus aetherius]|uniref:Uncharacterized protein n=1 Tax=Deinococcus aetherius TaxID=200252 RepID=A0ABN6RPD0_9DEIO|nr:hypothetical protein DAETH_47180 [Deinococcus aetherius]
MAGNVRGPPSTVVQWSLPPGVLTSPAVPAQAEAPESEAAGRRGPRMGLSRREAGTRAAIGRAGARGHVDAPLPPACALTLMALPSKRVLIEVWKPGMNG